MAAVFGATTGRNRMEIFLEVIFFLAHQESLSYMCLFIEDLDKLTSHRFALQRKMPLDGPKGAR
jgi:hypothetical protein